MVLFLPPDDNKYMFDATLEFLTVGDSAHLIGCGLNSTLPLECHSQFDLLKIKFPGLVTLKHITYLLRLFPELLSRNIVHI